MSSGENKPKRGGLGNKSEQTSLSRGIQQLTCMLVAPVTDPGSRRPISSGQEESCAFHSEEAFADAARGETNSEQGKFRIVCQKRRAMDHGWFKARGTHSVLLQGLD